MRTLVTGATGFIGRHLLLTLKHSRHTCCAVTRRPGMKIDGANEYVCLDLFTPNALKKLPTDFDAVVHLADGFSSLNKSNSIKNKQHIVNQSHYTTELAQWALANNIKDFIYVSSDKAGCGETEEDLLTSDGNIKPESGYGAAKRYTEIQLSRIFSGKSTRLIILRHPVIHGPGCNGNIRNLLQIADSAWMRPRKLQDTQNATVSITNCCDAIKTALDTPRAPGGTYLIADDGQISTDEIIDLFRRELGRKMRLIDIPKWVGRFAKSIRGESSRKNGRIFTSNNSDHQFRLHFDWLPSQTTQQSLQDTARTYAREGK